jgi:hypothetical protein
MSLEAPEVVATTHMYDGTWKKRVTRSRLSDRAKSKSGFLLCKAQLCSSMYVYKTSVFALKAPTTQTLSYTLDR